MFPVSYESKGSLSETIFVCIVGAGCFVCEIYVCSSAYCWYEFELLVQWMACVREDTFEGFNTYVVDELLCIEYFVLGKGELLGNADCF